MKGVLCFLAVMVFTFGFAGSSGATLMGRAGGTMVYDDDLDITWLADANYAKTSGYDADGRMTWSNAVSWADSLVFGGLADWRLATSDTCWGFSCTGSEMGHLLLNELGGTAGSSILSVNNGSNGFDLFSNLQSDTYWSGAEYAPNTNDAWLFNFNRVNQYANPKGLNFYALAVRSGDVSAVPEPGTLLVLGSGLAGLALYRKKTGYIG